MISQIEGFKKAPQEQTESVTAGPKELRHTATLQT